MNPQKLTIREIILTACLCAEYFQEVDAESPFRSGFSLPILSHSPVDGKERTVCNVIITNIDEGLGLWSVLVTTANGPLRQADIINATPYINWAEGKNPDASFDILRLSGLENAGLLHPDLIDKTFFFIDYDEIPFALSLQELDEDGSCLRAVDEFDLADFAKAKEMADRNGDAMVFVDKRNCFDEDDSNPIIYPV